MQSTKKVKLQKSGRKVSRKYFRKKSQKKKKRIGHTVRVENAILATIGYRSIFNYPMSFYQLNNFLISKRRVNPVVLQDALNYLVKMRKIGVKSGRYYLYKTKHVLWKKRYNNSVKLFKKATQIVDILSKIPWIKLIGVTGAVAAFNSVKDDDIDFFIVTKRRRLWITRGFVFVILKILGQLRSDENPNRKICPNIFVDESNLAWNRSARNVYVAHEIVMLHPVFDRDQTYFKFMQKNDWVFKYFGNLQPLDFKLRKEKGNKNLAMYLLEELAYKMQVTYMKDKKTKEITTRNIIHFMKVDNTDAILSEFKRVKKRVGSKRR